MQEPGGTECKDETIELRQNHRVHIVRVVYQNVTPPGRGNEKAEEGEKRKSSEERKKSGEERRKSGEERRKSGEERRKSGEERRKSGEERRKNGEDEEGNWTCTCTVTPCKCSSGGRATASKCSSCDGSIEPGQQELQEPGPVQLEYSCRCHPQNDITVIKTVCAKCATKIHDLLADIWVCERQDPCPPGANGSEVKEVMTNSTTNSTTTTLASSDVCSNCQVVGSRMHLNSMMKMDSGNSGSSGSGSCDLPPPLPKRKFITRGAVRTPPPPKKKTGAVTAPTQRRSRSPPLRRRVQRTRSADSPSNSDSSLSDSSDYPNLEYKPGVIPNEYIESDDFPTTDNDGTQQNVPFDLNALNLNNLNKDDETNNSSDTNVANNRDRGDDQYCLGSGTSSKLPSKTSRKSNKSSSYRAATNVSPVTTSSLSSMCASPASVSHSSPETVSSSDEPKNSPMHTSISPSINSSKTNSPIVVLETDVCGDCDGSAVSRAGGANSRNYTFVEYHGLADSTVVDSRGQASATGDLIDLRSPMACSPPCDLHDANILHDFPIVLPEIEPPDFSTASDGVLLSASSLDDVRGAEGGACTPASFDLDFIVSCDEGGVPEMRHPDWLGSTDELTDDVFVDGLDRVRRDSAGFTDIVVKTVIDTEEYSLGDRTGAVDTEEYSLGDRSGPLDTEEEFHERPVPDRPMQDVYARAHRRTGSAGARVERADSPPPKLPLKPSLSLNQTPPPLPKRDFRPKFQVGNNRPHRVSRPQAFEPAPSASSSTPGTREKPPTQPQTTSTTSSSAAAVPPPAPAVPAANLHNYQDALAMPDFETNRTVSQLVFGAEHAPPNPDSPPTATPPKPQTSARSLSVCEDRTPPEMTSPTSNCGSGANIKTTKKRPLSCLLKPKHTFNKIFHKKGSGSGNTKDVKDMNSGVGKPALPATQRELPPIPTTPRPCELHNADESGAEGGAEGVTIFCDDVPPPLLPREPVPGAVGGGSSASSRQLQVSVQHHNFIESLIKLREVGWYWGPLSMDKAEAKLADKKDGSFLVRDSSHDSYILSLSFRSQGRTHHTRIEFFHGTFGFWSQPSSHGRMSIVEFIEKAMEHSRNGKFLYFLRPHSPGQAPSPVVLLYPISRYEKLQSLQHACRFVILKYVRYDHIEQLPLPNAIKLYLKDKHYFAENTNGDSSSSE